mmetsp:Transcript_19856/g.27935  ORF Transcript_19856/g.27935 Transcript_19856/m.27935 type:complete len:299 (+) Transcript_19856:31-927(+)
MTRNPNIMNCSKRRTTETTTDDDNDDNDDNHDDNTRTTTTLPRNNKEYGKREYWEERFATETEFEWLVSYSDIAPQITRFLHPKKKKILVVGCGNSSFSADLYDAGYTCITNIDYSRNVIDAMRKRHERTRPLMEWLVMDMTDMSAAFADESFDVVIDKAAMDALMTQEGDVWNPEQSVVDSCRTMCRHISRVLKLGGYHLHISFAQPHFRKKYLLGLHPPSLGCSSSSTNFWESVQDLKIDEQQQPKREESSCSKEYSKEFLWDYEFETIGGGGNGDSNNGCFHHFLYIMQKIRSTS